MPPATPPPSPPAGRLAAPSRLDARLVLGVLLVLVSVVVGARVLAAADRTQLAWAATRDLAAGTTLQPDDVEAVEVRLLQARDRYLSAPDAPVSGYVLDRPVSRGELVPYRALVAPGGGAEVRLVSVEVERGRFPADLARGQRVDVWSTPDPAPGAGAGADGGAGAGSRLVLAGVPVHARPESAGGLSGAAGTAVVLAVDPQDVAAVLSAAAAGRIDLVRVPPAGGSG